MNSVMTAVEMTGVVEKNRRLRLDQDLPFSEQTKVRVIVLYSLSDELFQAEMDAFRQRLASHGYHSKDDIVELVRQIKREQADDWERQN
jgi:hypothetical protein